MLQLELWNIIFTVINIIVLFVLLRIFLFKPIKKIIAARQEEANSKFDEATTKEQEALALKSQYEAVLMDAEGEKKKVIREARKSADEEYQRIVDAAHEEARTIKEVAVSEAEGKKTEILKKAEQEIAGLVVDAAAKVVAGNRDNSAVYDTFLNKAGEEE